MENPEKRKSHTTPPIQYINSLGEIVTNVKNEHENLPYIGAPYVSAANSNNNNTCTVRINELQSSRNSVPVSKSNINTPITPTLNESGSFRKKKILPEQTSNNFIRANTTKIKNSPKSDGSSYCRTRSSTVRYRKTSNNTDNNSCEPDPDVNKEKEKGARKSFRNNRDRMSILRKNTIKNKSETNTTEDKNTPRLSKDVLVKKLSKKQKSYKSIQSIINDPTLVTYNFNTSSLNQNKINNDSKQPIQSIQMNASIKAPLNDVINKAQIVRHPSYNSHKSQSMTSAVLGSEYSFSNDLNPDSTLQSIPIELQDRTNQVVTVKEVHPSYDEEFTEGSGDLNFLKQCLKCCRKNCCTLNTVMQKVYFISVITFIYLRKFRNF